MMNISLSLLFFSGAVACTCAFSSSKFIGAQRITISRSSICLNGLFDNWSAAGSGKDRLDEEWEKQQEILKFRKSSSETKAGYFEGVSQMSDILYSLHVDSLACFVEQINVSHLILYEILVDDM